MRRWWRRQDGVASCREVGRALQRYLDGETDELQTRRIARHLEDCLRCGLAADTYLAIKQALGRQAPAVPSEAVERLRAFGERLAEGDDRAGEEPAGA